MGYVLGLDLGSNSIGWALVEEMGRKVLRSGVRIFPEGVDRDKQGGEVSKNENRRMKRGMRRQVFRRARRKRQLRDALVKAGLLPGDSAEQQKFDGVDPYVLRVKGLDEKLEKFELGRVLIHLNQRRGFKSNRKGAKTKEEKGMLAEMGELAKEIETSDSRTLGEYLHKLKLSGGLAVRIRGKHTRREMLQQEFDLLWKKQREFYPDILTKEFSEYLDNPTPDPISAKTWMNDGLIFGQHKMYWPKSVVGKCELEPKERRCRRSHRLAQRFRMLQEVNNLMVIESTGELRALRAEERAKLIDYLSMAKERTFDEIRKHLKLLESHGFNLEFGDRRKLLGLSTDVLLSGKKLFGKAWAEIPESRKNQIVNVLLDDGIEEEEFRRIAREEWKIEGELAESLLKEELPEGYASYSLKAITKLLPFLEEGLMLSGRKGERDALHAAG